MTESANAELLRYAADIAIRVNRAMRTADVTSEAHQALEKIVDGEPTCTIERLLDRDIRRATGIFFSGTDWADVLVENIDVARWKRFFDPACGTGDLLLAVARRLPLGDCVSSTLAAWNKQLIGGDVHSEFVQIARQRLRALAVLRHGACGSKRKATRAGRSKITVVDALSKPLRLEHGDCVLMNPPFHLMIAPDGTQYGSGRTCAAALFLERVLRAATPGVGIFALLPDVLRCGTRYARLRNSLAAAASVSSFEPIGRFSKSADVDVALLTAVTHERKLEQEIRSSVEDTAHLTVGNFFEVHVGNVVPHRTRVRGRWRQYATAVSLPPWQTVASLQRKARYDASPVQGPLVLIRRTSSPSDAKRARATVLRAKDQVLIENHLLVCIPLDGTVGSCQRLLERLRDNRTDQWLNYRIRCRHLTVTAIADLPWWGD